MFKEGLWAIVDSIGSVLQEDGGKFPERVTSFQSGRGGSPQRERARSGQVP